MTRVNKVGDIAVDATMSESHTHEYEVTTNPVEGSAPITDHIIRQPRKFTITGVITNSPVDQGLGLDLREGLERRAESAYDDLIALADACGVVTLETTLGTLQNMALSSIEVTRDPDTGDAIQFTLSCQEIVIVGIQLVQLPVQDQVGRPPADRGKQPVKEVKEGSILYNAFFGPNLRR